MQHSIDGDGMNAVKASIFVDAIVALVRARIPYSFYVSKILWGLSLFLQTGSFRECWHDYPRISDEAKRIRELRRPEWRKQLTFEHARPLSQMYEMLFSLGSSVTRDAVVKIVGEYPPVLITRSENDDLNARGFKVLGMPQERYENIPISGFSLRASDGSEEI
ncbi:hypothetical protein [Bradyrhizobium sp. RD5-C2]|uniref:hypothetical protein n=1 Tax=Bradyrhizobium sp. RD5-C2 TaxID=244562 RepID=UPI001CC5A910|nr:hypothetical protein [Bradyrhizobium sp. RD5-C2]